jgi:UMF1 family MFS transporter
MVFMIPFFLWVRDPKPTRAAPGATKQALRDLVVTLKTLPSQPSLFAFLGSSMFYRDALNGLYTFGGLYAAGVLGWSVIDVGVFGILAILAGAIFTWLGGKADSHFGPKPVITGSIIVLTIAAGFMVTVSRESVLGVYVGPESTLPDMLFYVLGAMVGAAGGIVQSASRTMMVRQANPERMTEAFGLYALAGKATSFLAPLAIGTATYLTGSQSLGVFPLVGLFLIGLILLAWVNAEGDYSA